MLAKSKLNSIETLISQALIDMEISHKYEKMKENVRNASEKSEEKSENRSLNRANSVKYETK